MFKLFHSMFGGGEEARGRYPESLIEAAIERAVEGTDSRLRFLPGYRKKLREPVIQAMDQVVDLVDSIPEPLLAGRGQYSAEPRLSALFASADAMLETLARDNALMDFLAHPPSGDRPVTALLLAERVEKNVLGMDLVEGVLQRDVPQVAVSFSAHSLLDPRLTEVEARRHLKRRAFDHLLTQTLARLAEVRLERDELGRQRDLLRRKLSALARGGWSFDQSEGMPPESAALHAELEAISSHLEALGAGRDVLRVHLELVAEMLGEAEKLLWSQGVSLCLDSMNIQRDGRDPTARRIELPELHYGSGRRSVMLMLSIAPSELPRREDFVTAAQRYLF